MINTALYYPYIEPPHAWLKRSLLIFESTSSIVPNGYGALSSDLAWLADEGAWRPTTASWLSDPSYRDDIETALLAFADNRRYRFNKAFVSPRKVDRLFLGKLRYEIEDTLRELQLAKPGHAGYLIVHRDVQTLILAVTAKYIAAQNQDINTRIIPATDIRLSADHAFSAPFDTPLVDRCVELSLEGLLPTPGPDVSLPDIIHFREQHHRAVSEFRVAIRSMMQQVAESDQPFEVVRTFREQVEDATAALSSAAKRRRVTLVSGTTSVLLAGAVAGSLIEPSTIHWVFDGIGTAVVLGLVDRRARRTQQQDETGPFAYIYEAGNTFAP